MDLHETARPEILDAGCIERHRPHTPVLGLCLLGRGRPHLRVTLARRHGARRYYSAIGGSFEGPRLRGEVLPDGGDWLLTRPDGVLQQDARITLKTDDGHSSTFDMPEFG